MTLRMRICCTVLLIMMVCECRAIPANPMPCRMKQPDGAFVTVRMQGDEYLNFVTTTDGFTVVRDERGFWVYANKQADGSLAATGMVAHDADDRKADERAFLDSTPKWLAPKMSDDMAQSRQRERARRAKTLEQRRAPSNDYYSKFRGLVILVEYKDRPFMYGDETNDIFNDIFNKENYTGDSRTNFVDESLNMDIRFVGSVHDYYRDNSNGLFQPKFDIVGPVKVNLSQYDAKKTRNGLRLAQAAVNAADPLVDFSKYDADGNGEVDFVYFVFSGFTSSIIGNDERLLWPHQNSLYVRKDGVTVGKFACSTEMGYTEQLPMLEGIGAICHEMAHVLGLPDSYDTDQDGSGGTALDPGGWSIMASGGDHRYRRIPSNFTLYERYLLGFCPMPAVLNEVGSYSMRDVTTNEGFRIDSSDSNEFFIIENRQQTGWDVELPGHGMLVFRVEDNPSIWKANKVNDDPNHMCYELLFAEGYKGSTSAYDPFPGMGNVTMLTPYTSPAYLRTRLGENCEYGLAHITETDGVIAFDLVEASTFKEIVMPRQIDLYEGFSRRLEPQVYLSKMQYKTKWESDNPKVATVDADGKVTALDEGTAHVTLTADDLAATCTVTVPHTDIVPSIESLLSVANNTNQVVQLNDAQVFFVQKTTTQNRVFVRDGTRSFMLNKYPFDLVPGDVLNGRVVGSYKEDIQWITLNPLADIDPTGPVQITHGDLPEPDVVTFDNIDAHHVMDYIKMQGVTLGYVTMKGKVRLAIVDGERPIAFNNTYLGLNIDLPSEAEVKGNRYDVEAIISYYNIPGYDDSFLLTAPLTLSQDTGISPLPASLQGNAAIYNLQGQRVAAASSSTVLPKGVYIVNGKKFIAN